MSNSDAARRNAARPSNPARMRLILALQPDCECGQPARVRVPTGKNGGYKSFCLDCHLGIDFDSRLEELLEMLDSID